MVIKLKGPKEGGREHFPFHLSYTYLVFPVTNLVKSQIWPYKELAKSPF